ncbi:MULTISPECIES: KamA family radical SAM protein [unclassified Crossiella]|uniref:KamA family radical SAM protein n=1 Tax=unclassified Crossiella TaxID=2620835 RepID=UPI001FFE629B|nr:MULTISPECIES: lysine 2,3-aminomutase [unclassified Crossiella]MCK2244630.1 lysine 2,3-aminomutase [Crossiella sp. S99.2]MCK2258383.1 lysine 2,3-aminomutase [Crossiella sp. S99.1]
METGLAGSAAAASGQEEPYRYRRRELREPDWRRFPGWREVTPAQWRAARWQRAHSVRNARQLRALVGDALPDGFYRDWADDRKHRGTWDTPLSPQQLNTVAPEVEPGAAGWLTDAFYADPVRRYILPVRSDRLRQWPSHPLASRDPLHEQDQRVVEGLTHRFAAKVLVELLSTCSRHNGHCTRTDPMGTCTAHEHILAYLRAHRRIRDVVVAGSDLADVPWPRLSRFLTRLLEIEHIRDIGLASRAVISLPQQWGAPAVLADLARIAGLARRRGVRLAMHTRANAAQQITPMVAETTRGLLAAGLRDVRNQGVLLRGINDSRAGLLELCFTLCDHAMVQPSQFYLCDLIPGVEHWRVPVSRAQELQRQILGYLPRFATPQIVCDVPLLGKRGVERYEDYDRERGITRWTRTHRTPLQRDEGAEDRGHRYYDPIDSLPESGRQWWLDHHPRPTSA